MNITGVNTTQVLSNLQNEKTKSFVESNGWKPLSYQTTFNADGSITTETCSQSEVDPGTEKARKELEERIEKRREECPK